MPSLGERQEENEAVVELIYLLRLSIPPPPPKVAPLLRERKAFAREGGWKFDLLRKLCLFLQWSLVISDSLVVVSQLILVKRPVWN